MQHTATSARELQGPPHTPPDDRLTREARAWIRRCLDWERHLAELRVQAERNHGVPTAGACSCGARSSGGTRGNEAHSPEERHEQEHRHAGHERKQRQRRTTRLSRRSRFAAGGRGNVRTETLRAFTEDEAKKLATAVP